MKQKIVVKGSEKGSLREVWVDLGPGGGVPRRTQDGRVLLAMRVTVHGGFPPAKGEVTGSQGKGWG